MHPESAKNMQQGVTLPPHVTLERALHAGPEMDKTIEKCLQTLLEPEGLHSVAQLSAGIQDFAADVFEHPDGCPDSLTKDLPRLRIACQSAARLVSLFTAEQDGKLEEVRTGRLIRVVLHAEGGAIFCYSVVPGQYIVGFKFCSSAANDVPPAGQRSPLATIPGIRLADQAVSRLVTTLREQVSLRTQNPGGWGPDRHGSSSTEIAVQSETGPEDQIATLSRAAIDASDLQMVTRCRGTNVEFAYDYLEHPDNARFFGMITVDARRKFYQDYALEMANAVGQLGRLARSTVGGRVQRLVLDVEQGAIYYYRLRVSDYLIGVTLDQDEVSAADNKISSLALRAQEILGLAAN